MTPDNREVRSPTQEGGMRIMFDPALDGPSWPGPLGDRNAAFGEAWLGPLGLLTRLQTELGLAGGQPTHLERVADFVRKLTRKQGFWSASFEADSLATSRRLLEDRDILVLAGWKGQAVSPRLAALWEVTADALPGVPDVLAAVVELIPRRTIDIRSIALFDPIDDLPPLWARLFEALRNAGVQLDERPLKDVAAQGDLAHGRHSGFTPVGDGSLTLLRSQGPLAAAEEVAAVLAALDSLEGVVVVGADSILGDALVRHGLPRLGCAVPPPASAALVRLAVETAFAPMEPALLHALLCADPGPVPRSVAGGLAFALGTLPGRGSAPWGEALALGLAQLDEARRAPTANRLSALLDPVADHAGDLPFDQVQSRMRVLASWARGRLERDATLLEVIAIAERLVEVAGWMGVDRFSRAQLIRICDEVDCDSASGSSAEVGLAAIPEPAAMLGPARFVVWWDFARDRAPFRRRLRLSAAERRGLRDAGVRAPDAGSEMAGEARRWRRPLRLTSEALVLVCPLTGKDGDPGHPHPLWDELTSSMTDAHLTSRLHVSALKVPAAARRQSVSLREPTVAVAFARAPHAIALRELESPSSVEKLLGCSMAWALHYPGKLRRGLSSGPGEPSPLLFGKIAHHILAKVFIGGALPPAAAATRAEELLAAEMPRICESLLLPAHQGERAVVKRAIVDSARELASILERTGASVRGTEVELSCDFATTRLQGRADLLLSDPDLALDLKWGVSGRKDSLESGSALQLAAYAHLSREGDAALPGIAYFILSNQRVFAERGTCLTEADCPGNASAADTWAGAVVAFQQRLAELALGQLAAPGAVEDPEASALAGGMLRMAPGCRYCELHGLCGREAGK
jgi:hypothetical protein